MRLPPDKRHEVDASSSADRSPATFAPVEDPVKPIEVGELVPEIPPLNDAQALADEVVTTIIGNPEETGATAYRAVLTHVESGVERIFVLRANESNSPVVEVARRPDNSANVTRLDSTNPAELTSSLKPDQLANALANAVVISDSSSQSTPDVLAARAMLRTAIDAVRTAKDATPTIPEIRDVINLWRGTGDTPTLAGSENAELRDIVYNALTAQQAERASTWEMVERVGAALDVISPLDSSVTENIRQGGENERLSVIHVEVDGDPLEMQVRLGALALLTAAVVRNSDGPSACIVDGAENLNKTALGVLVQGSKASHSPIILTATEMPHDSPLSQIDTAYVVHPVGSSTAANVSKALGTVYTTEVTGASYSESDSRDTSENTGLSRNIQLSGFVDGGGQLAGMSTSSGKSYSYSKSTAIGEVPRLRASDVSGIPPGSAVIVSSRGVVHGLYSASGQRTGDYPFRGESSVDTSLEVRRVAGQDQTKPAAALPPRNIVEPAGNRRPWQYAKELTTRFNYVTGDTVLRGRAPEKRKEWTDFLRDVHDDYVRDQHRQWQAQRGEHGSQTFSDFLGSEGNLVIWAQNNGVAHNGVLGKLDPLLR